MPPRIVTILVPIQLAMVMLGFAICHKIVRFIEKSDVSYYITWVPWPVHIFIQAGWLLLLLPIVWGGVSCLRAEVNGNEMEIREWDSRIGVGMAFLLACFVMVAILFAIAWAFGPIGGPLHPVM